MVFCRALVRAETSAPPQISSPTIRAVHVTGNKTVTVAELENRLSVKSGSLYEASQFQFSRDLMMSIYRDKGFADVEIATRTTSVSPRAVDVHFLIEEGPLYRVRSLTVEGNERITEKLVLRDFGIKPGDPFSQTQMYNGNKNLFHSGYFETTDITYSSAPAHQMDIHLKLQERPTQYVKGGFGYGTQTKERVSVGYEDRNFFGHAKKLDVTAVHSGFLTNPHKYRTTLLETTLQQPRFLGTTLEGQTGISEEWDEREPYDSRTTAWRSSLGRNIGPSITVSLRYRFQGTHISRIDPAAAATTPSFTNVSAVGPTFTYDNTNDPFLPTIGWRVTSLFEKGFTLGLGDLNFQRMEARAGRFDTLFYGLTTFAGLQAGVVRPDHPGDSIPIFERFMLGGGNSVRGYEEQELGPQGPQGSALGGNAFLVGNLEVRHALYKKLYGLWFLDGGQLYPQAPGDAWPRIHASELNDLAFGTGPGIRLNTPVGAVRLEVGYKLNPPDPGSPFLQRTSIHFSLGEVF